MPQYAPVWMCYQKKVIFSFGFHANRSGVFEYGILFETKSGRSLFRQLSISTPPRRIFVNLIMTLEE
jgi:hypothetical protein